jgi:hypothetical protein
MAASNTARGFADGWLDRQSAPELTWHASARMITSDLAIRAAFNTQDGTKDRIAADHSSPDAPCNR